MLHFSSQPCQQERRKFNAYMYGKKCEWAAHIIYKYFRGWQVKMLSLSIRFCFALSTHCNEAFVVSMMLRCWWRAYTDCWFLCGYLLKFFQVRREFRKRLTSVAGPILVRVTRKWLVRTAISNTCLVGALASLADKLWGRAMIVSVAAFWVIIILVLFLLQRRRFLLRLRGNLPSPSPTCREWPASSPLFHDASQLLRDMHHQWRVCWKNKWTCSLLWKHLVGISLMVGFRS